MIQHSSELKTDVLKHGTRVRLTIDMPDESYPLFAGDEGIIYDNALLGGSEGWLGFTSDRYDGTHVSRKDANNKTYRIVDFCEPIEEPLLDSQNDLSGVLTQLIDLNIKALGDIEFGKPVLRQLDASLAAAKFYDRVSYDLAQSWLEKIQFALTWNRHTKLTSDLKAMECLAALILIECPIPYALNILCPKCHEKITDENKGLVSPYCYWCESDSLFAQDVQA